MEHFLCCCFKSFGKFFVILGGKDANICHRIGWRLRIVSPYPFRATRGLSLLDKSSREEACRSMRICAPIP